MLEAIFVSGVNEIKVSGLYQWDRGQMLRITCPDLPAAFQVHFAKRKSKKTIDVQAESADNVATVAIPDELLQEPFDLYAYLYFDEGLIGETAKTIRMPIRPRVKPDDYVIDLPQEQMTEAEKLIQKMMGGYSEAAGHQPIIRDGTWWTWDVELGDYVDTGTTAEGEQGEPGVSGVYVGSGDMPDGYNVQIDPTGETESFPAATVVDALPEATEDMRGTFVIVPDGDTDKLYICMTIAGVCGWVVFDTNGTSSGGGSSDDTETGEPETGDSTTSVLGVAILGTMILGG